MQVEEALRVSVSVSVSVAPRELELLLPLALVGLTVASTVPVSSGDAVVTVVEDSVEGTPELELGELEDSVSIPDVVTVLSSVLVLPTVEVVSAEEEPGPVMSTVAVMPEVTELPVSVG